jgi:hypothetical protein
MECAFYAAHHFVKSRLFLKYSSVFTNSLVIRSFIKTIKKSPERQPLPGILTGIQPLKSAKD